MKSQKQVKKGFTIIEVLIVLAIAGLILIIVFLAVPALQRNSRNTQRKADVSVLLGAISEYQTNRNGRLPAAWDATDIEFQAAAADANGTGVEPKLGFYLPADVNFATDNTAIAFSNPITSAEGSRVYVRVGGKCNSGATNVSGSGATSRSVAIVYVVETSGELASICQES